MARPLRTGDEPSRARSPLGLRLVMTIVGLVFGLAGTVLFTIAGHIAWAVVFAVTGVIAAIDMAVVIVRIRQGPHFQPGPTTPPYHPVTPDPAPPRPPRPLTPQRVRERRYLALMGLCLFLLVLAWAWIRFYSVTAAVVLSLIAMVIPPVAAIVANAGVLNGRRRR